MNNQLSLFSFLTWKQLIILLFITVSGYCPAQENSEPLPMNSQYQPGDHELFLMPTAYTMEQGSGYFSNYELVFLNLTFAPSSTTHIGTFFLFPITSTFLESISFGVKQNYYRSDYFQSALFGSYTVKNGFYMAGNVISAGGKSTSFHLGLAFAGETEEDNSIFLILLGGRFDLSNKLSGIVEYTNAKELFDEDFNGLLTFGFRFRGESTAWELAGVRPLANTGDLWLIPFLKATFLF